MLSTPSSNAPRAVTCRPTASNDHEYPNCSERVKSIMKEADTNLDKVIAEANALTRALAVVEADAPIEPAHRACSQYLERHEIDSVEALVIDCALRKICGLPSPTYTSTQLLEDPLTLEEVLLQEGVIRWLDWAGAVHALHDFDPVDPQGTSALDRIALTQWLEAVEHLCQGNPDDARRYFRRAVTLGGLYGTPSNPVIQWTYAASFFPHG